MSCHKQCLNLASKLSRTHLVTGTGELTPRCTLMLDMLSARDSYVSRLMLLEWLESLAHWLRADN
jgi:hypothetical protein